MTELIITEKPNAAKKIAEALAESKIKRESDQKVAYFSFERKGKHIVVASAVGHLYGLAEKNKKGWTFPVFDIEWVPTADIDKEAAYSRKYLTTLKKIGKGAKEYTVATDYDIEGEVIGLNIIRYLFHQKDAHRMKFSTLTQPDLIKAYEQKSKHLDWGQAKAGEARHKLDWFYGVNTSRALTSAIKKGGGMFKILSTGRVQGPALKILVEREKEIKAFKPEPYWQLELLGKTHGQQIEAWHEKDKFTEQEEATTIHNKIKEEKEGSISNVERRQFQNSAPNPFDLTTLQTEAYRALRINPKDALSIAQELYVGGYISYPRTSSQQLPKEIGYAHIMRQLEKQSAYKTLAGKLLKGTLEPNNGKKTDPAHPAIYPTGIAPKTNKPIFQKVYDLIVKRFLATFAPSSLRETMTITIAVKGENFLCKGTRTIEQGWQEFYEPYVGSEEETLPPVVQGEKISISKINLLQKETQPPKRYTPASIIKELERLNLGTKATRAQIIETLYARGYVDGQSLAATELGIQTLEVLDKYSPEITDVELTRQFEDEMEEIREGKKTPDQVLDKARAVLTKILEKFKGKEQKIGEELGDANRLFIRETTTLGPCPICKKGELVIRKGKFGRFAACNKYPDCKTTVSLPAGGSVKVSDKVCEACGYPIALIIRKKRKPQELCINKECKSKKLSTEDKKEASALEGKQCEKCKKGIMVLRKSVYGSFLGCSTYPACRNTVRLGENGKQ